METIYAYLIIALGIALRIGIPILVTALISVYLHRLDQRWQEEGEEIETPVEKPECWKIKGCLAEDRARCSGYLSPLPCWQARRLPNGYLNEACLTCVVFRRASVPVLSHA
ncbi:MAG TPA: hypothetical protein VLZ89_05260 [Anaerolineales bacterium]|nr:hypothetical protein [Anaerolineales bacterium]